MVEHADDAIDFEKPGWQVRLGARMLARDIELNNRRREARAVRLPDHIDLESAEALADPDSGRRSLAPDPALVLIGRYLRRSRRLANLTQQALADLTGVSQSMISRTERGVAPAMAFERLVTMCGPLARLFPLGACPHDHECAWQPVKPRDNGITDASAFLQYLLKTASDPLAGAHDAADVEIGIQLDEIGALADGDAATVGDAQ